MPCRHAEGAWRKLGFAPWPSVGAQASTIRTSAALPRRSPPATRTQYPATPKRTVWEGVLDPLPDRRRLDTAASGPIQGGNMALRVGEPVPDHTVEAYVRGERAPS